MEKVRVGITTIVIWLVAWIASAQTSSVNGRVTSQQGAPVADADISLLAPPPPAMPGMSAMKMVTPPLQIVRSRPDGTFVLAQVPAGSYVLQVDAPGLARSSQELTVPSPRPLAISLETIDIPGAEAAGGAGVGGDPDTQVLR